MAQSPKEFAKLLTQAIHRIHDLTSKPIYKIEDELGEAINHTRETIEKWRRGKLPADLEQAEVVAKMLLDKGGLINREEFEDFLSYAGQARPATIWKETKSSKVDCPAPDEYFIGREDKVKELLDAIFNQETKVVSLCGPGGVGKTALITTAIDQLAPDKKPPRQFPDGILYYNFYGHYSVNDACRYIIDFFSEEESQGETPRDAARKLLRGKQALLVLDGASEEESQGETPRDAARKLLRGKQALLVLDGAEEADDLSKILEIRDSNKVLIVTRYPYKARGRIIINLNPPLPEEAVSILKAWTTNVDTEESDFQLWHTNSEAEHAIAIEICELVGCLPLALRLAGRYMVQCRIRNGEYRELLKQTPLAVLHEGERQHESVSILLKKSTEILKQKARTVLAIIGLLSYDPFFRFIIEGALLDSTGQISLSIGELVRFGMVKRLPDDRYQVVHRLIQVYSREHLAPPDGILENLAQIYINFYAELIEQNSEEYTLESEQGHILAILNTCVEQKLWEEVSSLALVVHRCFPPRRFYSEDMINIISVLEVGIKAAQITKKQTFEAYFLKARGDMHSSRTTGGATTIQSIYYYNQALIIFRELGERRGELECLDAMANAYSSLEQGEECIKCIEAALPVSHELGYLQHEFDYLFTLAVNSFAKQEMEQVFYYFHQAAIIADKLQVKLDDDKYLSKLEKRIRRMLNYLERNEQAIEQQFIDLANEVGYDYLKEKYLEEKHLEEKHLRNLIDLLWEQIPDEKLYNEITTAYQQLIELKPNDYHLYTMLAFIHLSFAHPEEAIKYYQKRIELDSDASLDTYAGLGICLYHQDRVDEARKYFETVLAMWEDEKEKQQHKKDEIYKYFAYREYTQKQWDKYLRQQHYLNSDAIIGFKFFALIGTDQDEEAIAILRDVLKDSTSLVRVSFGYSTVRQVEDNLPFTFYIKNEIPFSGCPQEEIIWTQYYRLFVGSPNPPQVLDTIRHIIEEDSKSRFPFIDFSTLDPQVLDTIRHIIKGEIKSRYPFIDVSTLDPDQRYRVMVELEKARQQSAQISSDENI